MNRLDRWWERAARGLARKTPRRAFLSRLGALLVGGAAAPLLPVARAAAPAAEPAPEADPQSCEYWRYCAMDGFLCDCCGGSFNTCPPGTEMSAVTWIGTCLNPEDRRHYVISYNDCCGKGGCGRCFCNRNEGDRPLYRPSLANDYNWCLGTASQAYHCSLAVVLSVAEVPS
jgi:methylamine dehydrogenase light chain